MSAESELYSIITTCHNYGHYLESAIESVLSQDDEHFELIVIDDGSKDETAEIAGRYGEQIRYFRQDHAGAFASAMSGVLRASGSRVVFVDADDRLRPHALRHLRKTASEHRDAALVLGRICYSDETGKRKVLEPALDLSRDPLENFARFCRGRLKAVIAGGLIDRNLFNLFDDVEYRSIPISADLAILGIGLLRGSVQSDFCTLDVVTHEGRLRDDVKYVDRSGLRLVDILFNEKILPPEALAFKRDFGGFMERERTRSYFRAGWYSSSWRSYLRAVRSDPRSLRDLRNVRRFFVSLSCDALRRDEGPVARPPANWLLGHHRIFHDNALEFTFSEAERHRTSLRLDLQRRTYVLYCARDARHVLSRNAQNYQPAGITITFPPFADGLVGMSDPQHAPARRRLAKHLDPSGLDAYAPIVADVLERKFASVPTDTVLDICPVIRSSHFEISCRIILGCNSADQFERLDHLTGKSHVYSAGIVRARLRLPRWVPVRAQRGIKKAEAELDELFVDLVRCHRTACSPSILEKMLAESDRGEGTSLRDTRNNVFGLLLAACDPLATPINLAIAVLGKDAGLQDKIFEEVSQLEGYSGGTTPDFSGYRKFQNLIHFVDELLRVYPSEWLLTRRVRRRDRLPSGLLVRRGNQVMVSIYNLHRNSDRFPCPHRFDPDRPAIAGIRSVDAYMPFGAGSRACLGQPLARMIMAISLATILRKWRIESHQNEVVLETPNYFSLQPQQPISVRLRERGRTDNG